MNRSLFYLVLLALAFLTYFLVSSAYSHYTITQALEKEGKVATVALDAKEFRKNKGGQIDYYLYYFSPGAQQRTEEKVDEVTYQSYEVGQEMAIVYVASAPHLARLREQGLSYRKAYFRFTMAFFLMASMILYVRAVYRRKG